MGRKELTYPHRVNAKFSDADMDNLSEVRRLAGHMDLSEALRRAVRAYAVQLRLSHPELCFPLPDLPREPAADYIDAVPAEADAVVPNGMTVEDAALPDNVEPGEGTGKPKRRAKPPQPSDNGRPKKGVKNAGRERKHGPPRRSKESTDRSGPKKAASRSKRKPPV